MISDESVSIGEFDLPVPVLDFFLKHTDQISGAVQPVLQPSGIAADLDVLYPSINRTFS